MPKGPLRALPRRSGEHFLRFSALFSLLLCFFSSSRPVLVPFWPHVGALRTSKTLNFHCEGHQIQAFRYFRFGGRLGSRNSSQNAPTKLPKRSKRYPRGAQECSGEPQESPKSLPKLPPESS